jgi:uncharacterized protein YhaN
MRLKSLYIDGFGIFHDFEWSPIPPGLSLIVGRNESGKTTLYHFIRQILFGLATRKSDPGRYPPLKGGAHGGRAVILDESGAELIVERLKTGKTTSVKEGFFDASQESPDPGRIQSALPPGDREMFNSVYSFTISELSDFESLSEEGVKSAIFSASMGLGGRSLPEVEKTLDSRIASLFKSGGTRPEMNARLSEVEDLAQRVAGSAHDTERYDELKKHIEEAERYLAKLTDDVAAVNVELGRTERMSRSAALVRELLSLRTIAARFPESEDFPEGGEDLLEEIKGEIRRVGEAIDELDADLGRRRRQLGRIPLDVAILERADGIEKARDLRRQYLDAKKDARGARAELEAVEASTEDVLAELGTGWSPEALEGFDASVATTAEVEGFQERLSDATTVLSGVNDQLRSRKADLDEADAEEEEARRRMTTLTGEGKHHPEELVEKRGAVKTAVKALWEWREQEEKLRFKREALEEARRYSDSWSSWSKRFGAAAIALAALAVAGAVGLYIAVGIAAAAACGAGFIVISGVSLAARRISQKALEEKTRRINDLEGDEARVTSVIEQRSRLLSELCGVHLEELCSAESAVDEMEAQLEKLQASEEELLRESTRRDSITRRIRRLGQQVEKLKREKDEAGARVEEVESEWTDWLLDRGLRGTLKPRSAYATLSAISKGRQLLRRKGGLEKRIREMSEAVDSFETMVDELARDIDDPEIERARRDHDRLAGVLFGRLEENKRGFQKRAALSEQVRDTEARIDDWRKKLTDQRERLQSLFAEAGAKDESEFTSQAASFRERRETEERIGRLNFEVGLMLEDDEDIDEFLGYFDGVTESEVEDKRSRLEAEAETIKSEQERLRAEISDAKSELGQLVSRKDLSEMQLELEAQKSALSEKARQWAELVTIRFVLNRAKQQYREKGQPEVIREAVPFFDRITGGAYANILAGLDGDTLEVVRSGGAHLDHGELSRGTADQLYLSLRFGYIRNLASSGKVYPVLVDEALVNFDPQRTRAALEGLSELARTHQVVFFTCHPEAVELARTVEPKMSAFELESGRIELE